MPDIVGPGTVEGIVGPAAPGSGVIDDTIVILGTGVPTPPDPTFHANIIPSTFRRLQYLTARSGMTW